MLRASTAIKVVAIGASTGGPLVLQTLLSGLPKNFPIPLLIVQHMASGFVPGFAASYSDERVVAVLAVLASPHIDVNDEAVEAVIGDDEVAAAAKDKHRDAVGCAPPVSAIDIVDRPRAQQPSCRAADAESRQRRQRLRFRRAAQRLNQRQGAVLPVRRAPTARRRVSRRGIQPNPPA